MRVQVNSDSEQGGNGTPKVMFSTTHFLKWARLDFEKREITMTLKHIILTDSQLPVDRGEFNWGIVSTRVRELA